MSRTAGRASCRLPPIRRWAVGLSAIASLLGAGTADAAKEEPLVLQPSSAWNMHYADDSCQLIRTFGEGDDKVSLELHEFGPGNLLTVLAIGKRLKFSGKSAPTVTEFGPGGSPHETYTALVATLDDGEGLVEALAPFLSVGQDKKIAHAPRAVWTADIDRKPLEENRDAEAQITQLRLSGPISRELVLELGPMDKPMDAMRVCLDSLLTHWGIDAAAHHSLTRRAAPASDPANWVKFTDLPTEMAKKARNGIVHARLMVNSQGKPTDCKMQAPFGVDFDKLSCQLLMQRARFSPALDAKGQPIASFYLRTDSWVIVTTTSTQVISR